MRMRGEIEARDRVTVVGDESDGSLAGKRNSLRWCASTIVKEIKQRRGK